MTRINMEIQRKIFTILGLPGSGKGTQAEFLSRKENLPIVGIGELIRKEIESSNPKDPFVAEINKRYIEGTPQPDDIVFDLVKKELEKRETGIIFDNFPFSFEQANMLNNYAKEKKWREPLVIYLKIDPESSVNRIIHRKVCSICGKIYIESETTMCESCGGALVSRADDKEEVVRKRIGQYIPRIEEVTRLFKQAGRLIIIDGEKSIQEVKEEIERSLLQFSNN
ncbi:MAG: nucleoside monophosphate kinase [Patescibacteria group bacterium]